MYYVLAHHIQHILQDIRNHPIYKLLFVQILLYVTETLTKVDSSPPTMKVRVPAAAPVTPPLMTMGYYEFLVIYGCMYVCMYVCNCVEALVNRLSTHCMGVTEPNRGVYHSSPLGSNLFM